MREHGFEQATSSTSTSLKELTIFTKRNVTELVDIYLSEFGTALDVEDDDGTTRTGQLQSYLIVTLIRYWTFLAKRPNVFNKTTQT